MSDVSRDTMLLTTPFHSRVEAMCDLNDWGNWMGYTTPNAYFDVELEYFAVRSTTGVFDLSPMNKYRVTGPDAQRYLDRLITRDVSKIGVDRVGYAIWCDDNGQVMDDGTIFRLGEQDYRICSYQRADDWLAWNRLGFDVTIENESEAVAGLAVQGPTSCTVLTLLGCTDLNQLKPFGIAHYSFEGRPLMVSRTGFTGDLGYEVWVPPESAEALWDQLFELGHDYLIKPIGSHALELARIEAVEGGVVREEDLKGALDGSEGEDAADGADAASEADDESPAEPVDQSKIDYQLARALDLIRGVAVFGALKPAS